MLFGIALRQGAIVAWGGAILFAVAVARASAMVSVARIRDAGFEMLWTSTEKVVTMARGSEIELKAEVRNRDTRAVRYVNLRPVAATSLEVRLVPESGEVPAGGRLLVSVHVSAPRVGKHAIHGLSLEVQGAPGLFEVPLTFANPHGVEVLPRAFGWMLRSARGGRSRMLAETGQPGPRAGDGYELRELREHQPGDSFKRIAWRASARRGQLLVRDFEREERDIAWIVLDASVELWAGTPGAAPLDTGIDEVAVVAKHHLARGDHLGLAVVGGIVRCLIEPDHGAKHAMNVASALVHATACYDADRSDLDERDVGIRVLEHMRPMEPRLADVPRGDWERLAFRAEALLARAPFKVDRPQASSEHERVLRQYLASYGVDCPPRPDAERARTDEALARLLERVAKRKPRASVVHIWSPAPDHGNAAMVTAITHLRKSGIQVRWIPVQHEHSIAVGEGLVPRVVADAVILRARTARERGEKLLRRMGVRVERVRKAGHLARVDLNFSGDPSTARAELGPSLPGEKISK